MICPHCNKKTDYYEHEVRGTLFSKWNDELEDYDENFETTETDIYYCPRCLQRVDINKNL